jgi:hypothetical protein
MTHKTDITDLLHSIGIRLGKETLRAILDDMPEGTPKTGQRGTPQKRP